jgi:hypothetical protein
MGKVSLYWILVFMIAGEKNFYDEKKTGGTEK